MSIKNYVLLIVVALGISMSFVACGDNDENDTNSGKPVSVEFAYNPNSPLQLCLAAQNHSEEEVNSLLTKAGFVMREDNYNKAYRNYSLNRSGHFDLIEYRTCYDTNTKTWTQFQYYAEFDSLTDIRIWANIHAADVRAMQLFVSNPTEVLGGCDINRITGDGMEGLINRSADNFASHLSNIVSYIEPFEYSPNDTIQTYFQAGLMCRFESPTLSGMSHGNGMISSSPYYMLLGEVTPKNATKRK